jgi:hypothetical protein
MAKSEGAAAVFIRSLKSVVFYGGIIILVAGIIFCAGYFTGKRIADKASAVNISRLEQRIEQYRESTERQSETNSGITNIVGEIESGNSSAIGSIQRIRERIAELESALRKIGVLVESADSATADISRSADGVIGN